MRHGAVAATAAHAGALARVHLLSFRDGAWWDERSFAALLADPTVHGLIAADGALALFRVVLDEAELLTLAVVPERRRGGLATALLRAGMEESARRGAGSMFLEVASDNAPARALYAAAGFAPVGRRAAYYGPGRDAVVMRAPLRSSGSEAS